MWLPDRVENHEDGQPGKGKQHGDSLSHHLLVNVKRPEYRAQRENQGDVGDIRAEDVAEGNRSVSLDSGSNIHEKLRSAGAEGHHGQTDHPLADADAMVLPGGVAGDGQAG